MARHKWDYTKFGSDTRDMLCHGRRLCTVCGAEHRRHQKQNWMRVVGYEWDGDGRTACPGRPHRWAGAGYHCGDCGGIKDGDAEPTCPGPPAKKEAPTTQRGDIVEFNGKRFVAMGFDRYGWYYSPATKAGNRPDMRKEPQRLTTPVKVGMCDLPCPKKGK